MYYSPLNWEFNLLIINKIYLLSKMSFLTKDIVLFINKL